MDEKLSLKNKADINSENIKNLVKSIYYIILFQSVYSGTLLYNLVKQFAKAFNEEEEILKLRAIWLGLNEKNIKKRVNIPTMEIVLFRDLSFPSFKLNKKYNALKGRKNEYSLWELNFKLQESKEKIIDIFFNIYLRNDVSVGFQFPSFQQQDNIMPSL